MIQIQKSCCDVSFLFILAVLQEKRIMMYKYYKNFIFDLKIKPLKNNIGIKNASFTLKSKEQYLICSRRFRRPQKQTIFFFSCSVVSTLRLKCNYLYCLPKSYCGRTHILEHSEIVRKTRFQLPHNNIKHL